MCFKTENVGEFKSIYKHVLPAFVYVFSMSMYDYFLSDKIVQLIDKKSMAIS